MHVLLIGSGGREHALAVALRASASTTRLTAAPGNAGIAAVAEIAALDPTDHAAVVAFCKAEDVGLVVVGPEAPLVAGLADDLSAAGIRVFGPSREAARLEGSKAFTKALCDEAGIPTAAYGRFGDAAAARTYVLEKGAPIVVKADGLAAGKGVVVAASVEEALEAVDACFAGAFGAAGAEVVIEECLVGEEASFFALSDGTTALALAAAQDHKRAFDGDTGPNTGGMGAYSPTPVVDAAMAERIMAEIVRPTVETLKRRGTPFVGVLFAGLMIGEGGPKLIEYNVRFGDPEAEVILPRLRSDLVALMLAAVEGRLAEAAVDLAPDTALTVVMASRGYPGDYVKGSEIRGLDAAAALPGVSVFHAGTAQRDGRLVATGGRVLAVTARGADAAAAKAAAYAAVDAIDWPGGFCRRDIGWRAVARERG
ncbi:phosphoribosylamine--glycine ligase [Oharaeibacter diazotrophicus]|uniref:Phosphoribosylamine--glycine ligase n=2 Tax=Oharaeibacter diazotrophicus TaxID=1920512 RepID=A0A4R6RBC3_9HYPH|nr:phosphoribosylamine--glycine ligase [Oharaeibacter diazotrophicus]TDP83433.1 phosphoribosylamine--glycine ligase [Oharaeibacter diazotrophicus]BBE72266.1 phosphoribosylamine-glycine ligase [Pleomorphomonas sp. SM30]GLS79036.1 phosphoribosylamine--glycine ligase [Oharaeibacter diazotrophicus]